MSYPLHGGQVRQIAERFGVSASELLDFSANINPDGPPAGVVAALRTSLDDLSILTEYPDLEHARLKAAIACSQGYREDSISIGNGFVPMLEAVLRALSIRRCVLPVPCFVEYRLTLERMGVEVVPHGLDASDCFAYKPESLLRGEADAILLANPQNPSGLLHDAGLVRRLVTEAAALRRFVLLDEAFVDYIPQQSMAAWTGEFPNLIVFRSVTKFYAMPGLRVAYAVSQRGVAQRISAQMAPWAVSTLASEAVCVALEDGAYAGRTIAKNRVRRDALVAGLVALGLTTYPPAANFVLFCLPVDVDPLAFWQRMIIDHSIVLRSCANYEALPAGHLRVAVRNERDNLRLLDAIAATLTR